LDDLQKDLEAAHPVLRIQLLGANAYGQEMANAYVTQGRELPWLQDVDANQDYRGDAAAVWDPSFRHLYILDGENVEVASFDLDRKDLQQPANYAALRELLIDAAMTSQRPWRNADNPLDVNHNGNVEALDALNIINRLNAQGPHELPVPQAGDPLRYYDCNGDNHLSPLDALNIINYLNGANGAAAAEGEGLPKELSSLSAEPPDSSAVFVPGPAPAVTPFRPLSTAVPDLQSDSALGREAVPRQRDRAWPAFAAPCGDAEPAAVGWRNPRPPGWRDGGDAVGELDERLPELSAEELP